MTQARDLPRLPSPAAAIEYWTDAVQRTVLFLDVMRARAAQYEAHAAEPAPNVLDYAAELVLDGRKLARPVNYLLARIVPPEGVTVDPRKRPFVIVDPRAGHGPGIGGFKADSEIGVAMKAGHPAYFIGFLPEPVPGQTILDVAAAEASFLEAVIARHPDAEGRPCVVGNCQAGWAVMIVAALRPELFVGNRLAAGEIRTADGTAIDLRAIRSPIVVFCSKGDNITPPQQALDWILVLYDSEDDIRAWGQTIVYTVHESVGHLGIFVSGGVARKEHDEFASNIDLIDVLPPGLYEAVLTPKGEAAANPDLVTGEWVMRCEARTLADIRALGGNDLADEREFEAAARLSEVNLALYRAFAQPVVRALASPQLAEAARQMHPLRLSYEMLGARNPWSAWIAAAAERVRGHRLPADPENPLVAAQALASRTIVESLEAWRVAMERLAEQSFHAIYGTPALQAALGIDTASTERPRQAARSKLHEALVERRIAELRAAMTRGGLREAVVRALLWVGMGRNAADERGFAAITRLRDAHPASRQMPLAAFKALVREQFLMLVVDEEAALAAIPALSPESLDDRRAAFEALRGVVEASGAAPADRLRRVAALFGLGPELVSSRKAS